MENPTVPQNNAHIFYLLRFVKQLQLLKYYRTNLSHVLLRMMHIKEYTDGICTIIINSEITITFTCFTFFFWRKSLVYRTTSAPNTRMSLGPTFSLISSLKVGNDVINFRSGNYVPGPNTNALGIPMLSMSIQYIATNFWFSNKWHSVLHN